MTTNDILLGKATAKIINDCKLCLKDIKDTLQKDSKNPDLSLKIEKLSLELSDLESNFVKEFML